MFRGACMTYRLSWMKMDLSLNAMRQWKAHQVVNGDEYDDQNKEKGVKVMIKAKKER